MYEAVTEAYRRRRAWAAGAGEVESIQRFEVFARDEWTCGVCSEPIDASLVFPDPWSATVDHVVPLSRGGAHAMANVQAAHWACNLEKRARVEELAGA